MIKMLKNFRASPNGVHIHEYEAGREYGPDTDPPMSESLAEAMLKSGNAVRPGEETEEKVLENDYEKKVVEPRTDFAQFDASDYTINEVLEMVENGQVTAEEALESEKAGQARRSLIRKLRR